MPITMFFMCSLLFCVLVSTSYGKILQKDVTITPSGVLQMTAQWHDIPKDGAT
jgi:hypothetical protein